MRENRSGLNESRDGRIPDVLVIPIDGGVLEAAAEEEEVDPWQEVKRLACHGSGSEVLAAKCPRCGRGVSITIGSSHDRGPMPEGFLLPHIWSLHLLMIVCSHCCRGCSMGGGQTFIPTLPPWVEEFGNRVQTPDE